MTKLLLDVLDICLDGKFVGISDGDTIAVLKEETPVKVRIAGWCGGRRLEAFSYPMYARHGHGLTG